MDTADLRDRGHGPTSSTRLRGGGHGRGGWGGLGGRCSQAMRHLDRMHVLERLPRGAGESAVHLPRRSEISRRLSAIASGRAMDVPRSPSPRRSTRSRALWMHRRVDRLPDRRVVIEFNYRGVNKTIIWLILDRGEPSVCVKHPGFDSDIVVTTDAAAFMRVFSGFDTLADARRQGTVVLDGPRTLTRGFEQGPL